jgi:hypothetical protein
VIYNEFNPPGIVFCAARSIQATKVGY